MADDNYGICAFCNTPACKFRCSACHTPYCNQFCQKYDWDIHRKTVCVHHIAHLTKTRVGVSIYDLSCLEKSEGCIGGKYGAEDKVGIKIGLEPDW
jgi:uncharacterized Fe-S cluster-containing radical SAM superfamily protein